MMDRVKQLSHWWGTTASERELEYPCDGVLPRADEDLYRGIDVRAPASILFAWLCQMKVAPYSYDWIDNFGRQSPERRDPEQERLEIGQSVMTIFRLVAFEPDRHLTLRIKFAWLFGDLAGTYLVRPQADGCRLLVKMCLRWPRGPWGWLLRGLLPWGDLVMMRKQFLNLRRLAERDAASQGKDRCAPTRPGS